ncbi:hypothetical protein [Sphingomonas sanxanigenens]|uniref:Bacteriophage tail tape measure C-terminal domain-containing protein n=1 Tax=Sphingomonas sanxanigenens DSM 19645 = NX02 TaxID=1123269 RepID=W0ACD2_9SPHN|nr:hypothetical protein [Sphingomonas sanxanigenens]AHE55539.1 hypothetical protein NX02_19395 [Sphingomonas sanxanigenens DSM 19645 = NX02]
MATSGGLIGALRVTLGLDSANFEAGTKRARQEAAAASKDIQAKLAGISAGLKGLATGAVAAAFIGASQRALDYASSLGEVAAQLGVSTKELQEFRYAATQTGVEQDQMDKGLQKLTKTIGEAHAGTKAAAQVFRDLNVSIYDGQGNVVSAGVVIVRLADALSAIKDPATRAKREVELFSKVGQELEPLLKEGSGAIEEMAQRAQKLGLVLSDDLIGNADEAADKLSEMKQVLELRFAAIVAENTDGIMKLADAIGWATEKALVFFSTMKGVERIKRDEGFWRGFTSGPAEQAEAADPVRYVSMRTRAATQATERRRAAELRDPSKKGWAYRQARRDELEAGRLLEAARKDPDFQARLAASQAGPTAPSVGELPEVKDDKKKKGSSGPTDADRARNRAEELDALNDEYLGLQIQLANNADERARLEHIRLANGREAYNAEIDEKVKKKELSPLAAEELKLRNEQVDDLRAGVTNREYDEAMDRQSLAAKQASLQNENDILRSQASLADTAKERRAIELKLLENQYEMERVQLEAIKNSVSASDAEKALAQQRLDMLGQLKANDVERVTRDTAGPGESYLDELTKSAAEANEELEEIGVGGLKTLNDGLADAIIGAGSVTKAFKNMSNQIIGELARIAVQQAIIKPLAQALFGSGESSGGGGGIFGSLLSAGSSLAGLFGGAPTANQTGIVFQGYKPGYGPGTFGGGPNPDGSISLTSLPRFAKGGAGVISGLSGIDRNILSLNGSPIARVGKGELLSVAPANDGGGRIAQVVPSPYFDVIVDRRATSVAAPIGLRAATAGSQGAQIAAARKQSRVLP